MSTPSRPTDCDHFSSDYEPPLTCAHLRIRSRMNCMACLWPACPEIYLHCYLNRPLREQKAVGRQQAAAQTPRLVPLALQLAGALQSHLCELAPWEVQMMRKLESAAAEIKLQCLPAASVMHRC